MMPFSQSSPRVRGGSALVIVLAFVVLLTGAVVAFFARVLSEREVSNSSVVQTKVKLFAEGALDTIVSDLKQEIAAGSVTGTSAYYVPNSPAAAVPSMALAGTSSGVAFAPNLVKRSAYKQPFYSGTSYSAATTAPDRAAPSSSGNPSLNGRTVSLARWNKALLLPKAAPSSDTDLTPASTGTSSFVAPDWVLVGRDGANPAKLSDAVDKNTGVIGRYAYVIYDEGGLLDANVAGYPSSVLSATAVAGKNSLAFADLTQLKDADGNQLLLKDDVDALVGWRNYASAQANGSFTAGYTFSSGSSYQSYASANAKGFLSVSGTVYNGQTDRMFSNRQQLIEFFTNGVAKNSADARARLQNALQYLGSFSRDVNQPAYAPDPNRPQILSNTAADNYAGNDAAGHRDDINPKSFLSVCAAGSFQRNDGTQAVAGEPLVKKRFALNRLAWLTYQGPSAKRSMTDADMKSLITAGISREFLQQGDDTAIKNYFGLTWNSSQGCWTYDHGITGSVGQPIIGYLSKVRDASREPDFFELLKAAINAGAIAKGATDPAGILEESSAYAYDTKLDYAILQIGANIIDQFDCDGFPTRIRFNDGSKVTEFRGVENLPYYYRVRPGTVMTELPSPAPIVNDSLYHYSSSPRPGFLELADPWTSGTSLTKTGFYAVLWEPEVWNPHDVNSSLGNPRPGSFRIVADGAPLDADGASLTGTYNTNQAHSEMLVGNNDYNRGARTRSNTDIDATKTPASYCTSNPQITVTWKGDNTALTFSDNNGALFREPTLLAKPGIPSGSGLGLGPNNLVRTLYQDPLLSPYAAPAAGGTMQGIKCINDATASGTATYLGFYYGQGPMRWVANVSGSYWVVSANENDAVTSSDSGSTGNTFRMQYSVDGGMTWITYDEKYVVNIKQSHYMNVQKNGSPDKSYGVPVGWRMWVGTADPRTRRFGTPGGGSRGSLFAPSCTPRNNTPSSTTAPPDAATVAGATASFWVDVNNNVLMSDRWGTSSGFGWYDSSSAQTRGMPVVSGWYPAPASNWMLTAVPAIGVYYRPGLLSQNNPAANSNGSLYHSEPDAALAEYYADPDGVVRRAMGAYVASTSSAPATTTIGLPMARTGGVGAVTGQSQSRPVMLNRPFHSVAEMGYVFSGTPWRNLSMFTPESGEAALLDVFCIQPDDNPEAVVAGKVNLNTRQEPVIQAILAGAYSDELASAQLSGSDVKTIANALCKRTADDSTPGSGPLMNIADLVGRWNSAVNASQGGVDGSKSYSGFSADLNSSDLTKNNIQRFREPAFRAWANAGTARVWTLMIDVIAQTGRYPANAGDLDKFIVEGERRYWLHLAIDRCTGRIIDQQLELVRE